MSMTDELRELGRTGVAEAEAADDIATLEAVRVSYLGKKGSLTAVLRGLGSLPPEERPEAGKVANDVREQLEAAMDERRVALSSAALEARIAAEAVDVTLPGRRRGAGHVHLIDQVTAEIVDIFVGLGYKVASGPEVELDWYNFTALNIPPDHPARSLQDTFYVRDLSGDEAAVAGESDVVLRTQTSPVQVRVMERQKPPIYTLMPGRVYRRDIPDPSHLAQFNQIEGLVVDEGITFGDLKGTLEYFAREIFGKDRRTRIRPHFFGFTEPSAEMDVSCGICAGHGCRFCKGTGWLEILGCGMVDPNVFGYVGIDAERYTGFAFGMGAERIAALRHDIPDLRVFLESDVRFLRQF